MAQLLIALRRDAITGKQNIIVKLDSDADALPIEHEQLHRTLVEKLVGQGLDAEMLGDVVIERESVRTPIADADAAAEAAKSKAAR